MSKKKKKKLRSLADPEVLEAWKKAGIENDFIFYQCFRNKKILKPFLEALLHKKITRINLINAQHEIRAGAFGKYIRCDVYVEGENTVYIIEMQCGNYSDLFLRARYDHSASDVYRTNRGTEYNELGESIVIYICYDHPFAGSTRRMLTGITVFREQPELPYEDKVKTIFLDAAGTEGDVPEAIQNFLNYLRNPSMEIHDPWVKKIDREVRKVKKSEVNRHMFITREMEMKAEKVREKRAIGKAVDKAVEKKESDMIHTLHDSGMSADEISHRLKMDDAKVQLILQGNK